MDAVDPDVDLLAPAQVPVAKVDIFFLPPQPSAV